MPKEIYMDERIKVDLSSKASSYSRSNELSYQLVFLHEKQSRSYLCEILQVNSDRVYLQLLIPIELCRTIMPVRYFAFLWIPNSEPKFCGQLRWESDMCMCRFKLKCPDWKIFTDHVFLYFLMRRMESEVSCPTSPASKHWYRQWGHDSWKLCDLSKFRLTALLFSSLLLPFHKSIIRPRNYQSQSPTELYYPCQIPIKDW